MANNTTELVFILDRSGSMSGLESDTIGGFNSLIEKQRKTEGVCYVSTVLFDDDTQVIHDRVPLDKIGKMTEDDYYVRGCTALVDAIGKSIKHISLVHKYARKEDVPAHTMFVITTDGMENASHIYSASDVKRMITEKEQENGWEFIFIGANIDAVETAKHYGISERNAVNYHADRRGTKALYNSVSNAVMNMRCEIDDADCSWREELDSDFNSRK